MRKSLCVKKHRVNYKGRVFTLPLVIFMVLSFSLKSVASELPEDAPETSEIETNEIVNWPKGPETSGRSVILMENSTGAILYAKNIHERCYPAAMTAIVTSMLGAEMCDLDDKVEFSTQAVRDVPSGVVNIAIDPGEYLSVGC